MDRPRSIRWFGWSFLGSLALSLLSVVILWPQLVAVTGAAQGVNRLGEGAVQAIVAIGAVLPVLIGLLLWYFVTQRRSMVARWLTVLTLAYAIYKTATGLTFASSPAPLTTVCAAASLLLEIVALVMLFMPDARAWFDGGTERLK